jgi:hypothetical protein
MSQNMEVTKFRKILNQNLRFLAFPDLTNISQFHSQGASQQKLRVARYLTICKLINRKSLKKQRKWAQSQTHSTKRFEMVAD